MIARLNNQSNDPARYYPIWRLGTCARNSQNTRTGHENGRDLLQVRVPMSPPKPNQTVRDIELLRSHRPTSCPTTCAKTPPLVKSP